MFGKDVSKVTGRTRSATVQGRTKSAVPRKSSVTQVMGASELAYVATEARSSTPPQP